MSPPPPSKRIAAGELVQHVSRTAYRGDALYFGAQGTNRYDAPDQAYGVLYLGFDLSTALMESVFHKHQWHRQFKRWITLAEVQARMVRAVGVMHDLVLADLTAPDVIAPLFGLNLTQLVSRRYVHTQRLSRILHALADDAGDPLFDGVLYPSRNNFPASCVALFDRAAHKVQVIDDIDLVDHADWPGFVLKYRIAIASSAPRPGRRHKSAKGP